MPYITTVILAAGAGTRMKSDIPKVLHQVGGKFMVDYVIDATKAIGADKIVVVVGHMAETVKEKILDKRVEFATQAEQKGTGHAVLMAKDSIADDGITLLLCGDTPLIKSETLKEMIDYHLEKKFGATVLTTHFNEPKGYGRIVRDALGNLNKIVEQKDADEETLKINEVNSGIYCFDSKLLKQCIEKLDNNNAQGEYYITDVIGILNQEEYNTGAFLINDPDEIFGVNSRMHLAFAEKVMRTRIIENLMAEGVSFIDPEHTYIDGDVTIGKDTVIYPGVIIKGHTKIGEHCIIGHNSRIENSTIEDFVEIQNSTIVESSIDVKSKVGPCAYLRPNSKIGKRVKIGDFVEVKNSTIGDDSKASHLSYIGDAEVGKRVNIGCGVVFVNYDGKNKYKTLVEDDAFVGSNVNLVAPVIVREHGYIATGTTVTQEVPSGVLCVGRTKQRHIEGWVARKGLMKK